MIRTRTERTRMINPKIRRNLKPTSGISKQRLENLDAVNNEEKKIQGK
jgi:hypothetical protein